MTSQSTVQFEFIESFGFGLLVEPSILGTVLEFEKDGRKFHFQLPAAPTPFSFSNQSLLPPISRLNRTDHSWSDHFGTESNPWGQANDLFGNQFVVTMANAVLKRFIFGFDLVGIDSGIDAVVNERVREWNNFWFHMKDWIEVLTNQDSVNGSTIPSKSRTYTFWKSRGEGHKATAHQVGEMRAGDLVPSKPLTKNDLETAFSNAKKNIQAPLEQLLIRDARQALHNLDPRRALTDSATAIEVTISRILLHSPSNNQRQEAPSCGSKPRSLGALIALWRSENHETPDGLDTNFAGLRNRVIHDGLTPTRDQGLMALNLAMKLAEIVEALESESKNS